MSNQLYELKNNTWVGMTTFEIVSFPAANTIDVSLEAAIRKQSAAFKELLSELYNLREDSICFELMWVSEKIENQTFESKVRTFGIIRKRANDRVQADSVLTRVASHFKSSLQAMQYYVVPIDLNDQDNVTLSQIDTSCVLGIIKREKWNANIDSLSPYYYTDVIPSNNNNNYNSLISTLSEHPNCSISFQLFPAEWSSNELLSLNAMVTELKKITSGVLIDGQVYQDQAAAEPLGVYSYYQGRKSSPLFTYNILVSGDNDSCGILATKVISLLQSGEDQLSSCDLMCVGQTNEITDLHREVAFYPWNVNNHLLSRHQNNTGLNAASLPQELMRIPFLLSLDEANAFFRLPVYENNMAAIRRNQIAHVQEHFSSDVVNSNNIQIGTLQHYDTNQIIIGCPEKAFTKHALIVGTPGSGKTTFALNLLLQFSERDNPIPFLAIEPTKTEYRTLIDFIPNLQVFTPGNNRVSPYVINPFIPPKGITVEQYIPSLVSAFRAAFSMPSPLDMFFLKAVRTCYFMYGWKDYSQSGDPKVKPFGLHEVIMVFKQLLEDTHYSKEVMGNLESAGLLRLSNLFEQNSNIYDTINTVPVEDLLKVPTVIELNSIDNAEQKSLIMALLLINICVYTKHNQVGDGKLKNVILIDEAHVLLGGSSTKESENSPDSRATTVKAIQDMIAEIRAYGTSIIIADQSPTKVSREVVANTDIKIAFRLVQAEEKKLIADSTNMDDDAYNNLSQLTSGDAYVFYSQLESPQLVTTEDVRETKSIPLYKSDEEIANKSKYWEKHQELLIPYLQCSFCDDCQNCCDFSIRSDAEYLSSKAYYLYRKKLSSEENIRKCIIGLPKLLREDFAQYSEKDYKKLVICSRIKLLRKIQREIGISLSNDAMKKVLTWFPIDSKKTEDKGVQMQ